MTFITCGLSHKTAPLALREQMAARPAEPLLQNCLNHTAQEAMLLQTCNRTELYCYSNDPDQLLPWLAAQHELDLDQLRPHAYVHKGKQAVYHLHRVACGLDSMLVGEPQILGQVKQAYQQACQFGTVGKQLHGIVQQVFATSKRARTETVIGSKAISIAYAAAELVQNLFTDLSTCRTLLVGSGETIRLVADYLQQRGVSQFTLVNRQSPASQAFAQHLNADYVDIQNLATHLAKADLVISATACPVPFIHQKMIEDALVARQLQSMVLLDLAVPRDIDPQVGQFDQAKLFNIDDLQHVVTSGLNERLAAVPAVEQIIAESLNDFQQQQKALQVDHVIQKYRQTMAQLAENEVQRALQQLQSGKNSADIIRELSHRLLNKLSHQPTLGLQQAAHKHDEQALAWMKVLFAETAIDDTP